MPSVMGLLEAEERAARRRVEVLREQTDRLLAELHESETDWQELVIAQQRVGRVLAGQQQDDAADSAAESAGQAVEEPEVPPVDRKPGTPAVVAARPGSILPPWSPGADPGALAVDYQRILAVLADARRRSEEPMTCKQIATAMGVELTPSKIEGVVRSRARRLAERGWLTQTSAGKFTLADGPAGAASA
ncbi:hypothetical protein ABZ826_39285 [Streptomyces sp. NPDC047515]|uniref:hypothetical protein n=1 Tax=Streptomyces sp. NPDC047515 TaxID=3155380 RepID=UPI0034021644